MLKSASTMLREIFIYYVLHSRERAKLTCPRGFLGPEDRSGGMYRRLLTQKRWALRLRCVRQSSTCTHTAHSSQ